MVLNYSKWSKITKLQIPMGIYFHEALLTFYIKSWTSGSHFNTRLYHQVSIPRSLTRTITVCRSIHEAYFLRLHTDAACKGCSPHTTQTPMNTTA